MVIRRALPGEMEEILSLVCVTFEEQGIPRELDHIPDALAPVWWCARDQDRLVGSIASYTEEGKTHLGRFAVRPEYRGRGVGTRLLRFAAEELFSRGVERIYTESRPATVRILLKMGGRITGETFPFYKGVCTPVDLCREDYLPAEE